MVISANTTGGGVLSVNLSGNKQTSIEVMEASWRKIFPERPFEHCFIDKEFERLYKQERRLGKLIPLFSGLSITIALLGLFALTAYITELEKKGNWY